MKVYTQFLEVYDNKLQECGGSDGVFILDGRNNLSTQVADSMERMHQMRFVRSNIVGFRIYKGARFDNNNPILREWVRSGAEYNGERKW